MQVPVLDRREALKKAAAMFGAALSAPLAAAVASCADPSAKAKNPTFTDAERKLVSALSERIIPTTDTPGAIEAGVPDFIEMMLGDYYTPDYRKEFMDGVRALDAHATSKHGKPFADLTEEEMDGILRQADAKEIPELSGFFENAKQMTITGYYSSEVGMTKERVYLPVPGKYDGDYPYEKVGTLFTG